MTQTPPFSDAELMQQAQLGDAGAFGELARRYQEQLFRVAYSRLGRRDRAEDAVQDALLAAFKGRHTYRPQQPFRTWLWTILLNECGRVYRKMQRQQAVSEGAAEDRAAVDRAAADRAEAAGDGRERRRTELPDASLPRSAPAGPLADLLARERTALLERLLLELPQPQADALRLRFFGQLKFTEIAQTMACSLPTAKNRVRWGLLKLAERLKTEDTP